MAEETSNSNTILPPHLRHIRLDRDEAMDLLHGIDISSIAPPGLAYIPASDVWSLAPDAVRRTVVRIARIKFALELADQNVVPSSAPSTAPHPTPGAISYRPEDRIAFVSPTKSSPESSLSFSSSNCMQMLSSPLSVAASLGGFDFRTLFASGNLESESRNIQKLGPLGESFFTDFICTTRPSISFSAKANKKPTRIASNLFPTAPQAFGASLNLPLGCLPEIYSQPAQHAFAVFSAEAKSISVEGPLEIATYAVIAIGHHLFRPVIAAPPGELRKTFYATPPVCFSCFAHGYTAHYYAVELIGIAFLSPFSRPFFLGSQEHSEANAAVDAANDMMRSGDISKISVAMKENALSECTKLKRIYWTSAPINGKFYKVISADVFTIKLPFVAPASAPTNESLSPEAAAAASAAIEQVENDIQVFLQEENVRHYASIVGELDLYYTFGCTRSAILFAHLYKVYSRYAAAVADYRAEDPVPPQLVRARLLFGYGEVCVEMDWVSGAWLSHLSETEESEGLRAVAPAVMWLARRGLLYTDIRHGNILRCADGEYKLIDYDDCIVLPVPFPTTPQEVADAIRSSYAASLQDSSRLLLSVADIIESMGGSDDAQLSVSSISLASPEGH